MLNVNYGFPKMGGGGVVISGFGFTTVWGLHDFLWCFLPALVVLVSLFLKGEIEREMGRENNRGGFLLPSYVVFLLV